jgi:hypothetical protein
MVASITTQTLMHTHHWSGHPHIYANTDSGQINGGFYLHAPFDYKATAAQAPVGDDVYERPLPGYAEIVFLMERVRELAEEEGADDDILTLEGPDDDRHNAEALAWFEGKETSELKIHRVQVARSDLRQFWIWQLIPEVISQIEKLGNQAGEGRDAEIVQLLNALHDKTGDDCLSVHQREHLDTTTEASSSQGVGPRL